MRPSILFKFFAPLWLALTLGACGGGGSSDTAPAPPPVAELPPEVPERVSDTEDRSEPEASLPTTPAAPIAPTLPSNPGQPTSSVTLSPLYWAELLVANVRPEHNGYNHSPMTVTWAGIDGASRYENRSDCSGFATHVIKQALDLGDSQIQDWFGSKKPTAARFHDAVAAGRNFTEVTNVKNIRAGDIVAIKYLDGASSSTGHVMMVRDLPITQRAASKPLVDGTVQHEVAIIDSTASPHGDGDSRKSGNTEREGAGTGRFRLYTDVDGNITGYTWSLSNGSTYYTADKRSLKIGRIKP
jgi:hypothetical protein